MRAILYKHIKVLGYDTGDATRRYDEFEVTALNEHEITLKIQIKDEWMYVRSKWVKKLILNDHYIFADLKVKNETMDAKELEPAAKFKIYAWNRELKPNPCPVDF